MLSVATVLILHSARCMLAVVAVVATTVVAELDHQEQLAMEIITLQPLAEHI